jgi:hypothetical protein
METEFCRVKIMSITFNPKGLFQEYKQCECVEAYSRGEWLEGHEDCQMSWPIGETIPELNLSSSNTAVLLQWLGLVPEMDKVDFLGMELPCVESGLIPASDLLFAVAKARKTQLSEFTRSFSDTQEEGRARIITAQLSEERLQSYLESLAEIAHFAMEREVEVQYA